MNCLCLLRREREQQKDRQDEINSRFLDIVTSKPNNAGRIVGRFLSSECDAVFHVCVT
jgi:hypothetical protein